MSKKENERSKKVKKSKNRKKHKKILRNLIIVILVGIVVFTAFYVAPSVRDGAAQNQSDDGNMILSTDSELIDAMHLSSGDVAVTANSLVSFKSSGERRYDEIIGYAKPVFKSADKKYIVFDRSTGKYTIANRSDIVYQNDLDEEIINADIASNGNYAIITRSTQSTQLVTVYLSDNKAVFSWECTDDYLFDIALSKNGKSVAVSSLNVENGETYSKIYYFNIDSLEVEGMLEYPGETVYRIKFIDNKNLSIITDLSYIKANLREMKSEVISYEYDELASFTFGSKSSVALLTKEFGSLNEKKLTVINKNCEKVFEKSIESDILDFDTNAKSVYVLISGKVLVYSISSGERTDDIEVDLSSEKLLLSGSYIYTLSENGIYKYAIK